MDIVELIVERQLAEAVEQGRMATPNLQGEAIADIDEHRPAGWWAKAYVERELRRDAARPEPADEMRAAWAARSRSRSR